MDLQAVYAVARAFGAITDANMDRALAALRALASVEPSEEQIDAARDAFNDVYEPGAEKAAIKAAIKAALQEIARA